MHYTLRYILILYLVCLHELFVAFETGMTFQITVFFLAFTEKQISKSERALFRRATVTVVP